MRALVAAEHLEATPEEIEEELERTAAAMGVEADLLRENLRNSGRVISFSAEVSKMNASKWLSENVTYVDPDGAEIDGAMLREDQSEEGDESVDESTDSGEETDEAADTDA